MCKRVVAVRFIFYAPTSAELKLTSLYEASIAEWKTVYVNAVFHVVQNEGVVLIYVPCKHSACS